MRYRFAAPEDSGLIAPMNSQLILDEGHRNSMGLAELCDRMHDWLAGGAYQAVLFEDGSETVGYALFRREPDFIYLRQIFVVSARRRQGVARDALTWLWANAWTAATHLRIDVLVGNTVGYEFWRTVGFSDYCITMESKRAG